ncbi:MAG TPA: hypothetical protein DCQ98_01670 [Planctomycetaceae bacterium]|nr:hypothetical protein [Planctomycetaceae bacterium]
MEGNGVEITGPNRPPLGSRPSGRRNERPEFAVSRCLQSNFSSPRSFPRTFGKEACERSGRIGNS